MYQLQLKRHAVLHVALWLIRNGGTFSVEKPRKETLVTILLHYHISCLGGLPVVFMFPFDLTFLLTKPWPFFVSVVLRPNPCLCLRLPPRWRQGHTLSTGEDSLGWMFVLRRLVGKTWMMRLRDSWSTLSQRGLKSPLHKRGRRMASGIVANCRLNWNRIIHNLLVCQVQWEVKGKNVERRKKENESEKS